MTDHYGRSELDHRKDTPRVIYCSCDGKEAEGEYCTKCSRPMKFLDVRRLARMGKWK